jgi:pyruvate formate lyase activating enzyme
MFLFDLKIMDPQQHKKFTGIDNELILGNFRLVYRQGKKIRVRIPLVEGITDTAKNLDDLLAFLSGFPALDRIDLLPYHPIARSKYNKLGLKYPLENMEDYPQARIQEIGKTFKSLIPPITIGG